MNEDLASEIATDFANDAGRELALLFDRLVKRHGSMSLERRVGFGHACLKAAVATYLSGQRAKLADVPAVAQAAFDAMAAKLRELEASR